MPNFIPLTDTSKKMHKNLYCVQWYSKLLLPVSGNRILGNLGKQ